MQYKYSEIHVGQEFILKGERYIRLPHCRARRVGANIYITVAKHALVETNICPYSYNGAKTVSSTK